MSVTARIKCPNRGEKIKTIYGKKKESFEWDGDTYNLDASCVYRFSKWGLNTYGIDYVKGVPDPIDYWSVLRGDEPSLDKSHLTPRTVAETIRACLFKIPHFQELMLILVIVAIVVSAISIYFSYDAGNKAQYSSKIATEMYVYMLNMYNASQVVIP